ncbi:hypothetical protein BST97_06730 [Nonlabens spongiae]|uniref:Uncharacterized protein n=1 Tax=Nonlabens spongiae TaxID=331648 RepID=A0A1W6MJC9_9FLAO|nr:hypothetical protein [Nonlabens spongiae]ARN77715.1 hypothetical protein BST97_06730 [Nonlabens spongiae]
MKPFHTLLLAILILFPTLVVSQSISTDQNNLIQAINQILDENKIPNIKNLDRDLQSYKDDFEYIKTLSSKMEPHSKSLAQSTGWDQFIIPESSLTGYRCVKGGCRDGDGILEIDRKNIYYLGQFADKKAHGEGVLYFVDNGFLKGTFRRGFLQAVIFIGTKLQLAQLTADSGALRTASNWYHNDFDALYTGAINNQLEFAENNFKNKLQSTYMDLTLRQDDDGKVTSFFGKLADGQGNIYESDFKPDLKPADGKFKWTRPSGEIVESKMVGGEMQRFNVIIRDDKTIYFGEVDEEWRPHGKGFATVDGKRLPDEQWNHGNPVASSKPGKGPEKISYREKVMTVMKMLCRKEGWSKIKYCKVPEGNYVDVHSTGNNKIMMVNLTEQPQKFKIRLLFTNMCDEFSLKKWQTITIPAGNPNDLGKSGRRLFKLCLPPDSSKSYGIEIKGEDAKNVYWVIKK